MSDTKPHDYVEGDDGKCEKCGQSEGADVHTSKPADDDAKKSKAAAATRSSVASDRAEFYAAAGIDAGERITTGQRLMFGQGRAYRNEWLRYSKDVATPSGLARLTSAQAEIRGDTVTRNGQERFHFNGVASVTDKPYEMYDWLGAYNEIVSRDAFTETLASNPDVAFLINHTGLTLARTKNGSLELHMDPTGFGMDAWCNPERSDVNLLRQAVDDGDIDEMSFAFMIEEGEWSEDYMDFTIVKLSLNRGDVSAVNYGANPYTSIAARTPAILKDLGKLDTAAARRALEVLTDRSDIVKLDRLAEAMELVDREADEARKAKGQATRGAACEGDEVGRSIASIEAQLLIDEAEDGRI